MEETKSKKRPVDVSGDQTPATVAVVSDAHTHKKVCQGPSPDAAADGKQMALDKVTGPTTLNHPPALTPPRLFATPTAAPKSVALVDKERQQTPHSDRPAFFQLPLHAYQSEGVSFLNATRSAGLFYDMGLGKTCMILASICDQINAARAREDWVEAKRPHLIVLPKTVKDSWVGDLAKFVRPDAGISSYLIGDDLPKDETLLSIRNGNYNIVMAGYERVRAEFARLIRYKGVVPENFDFMTARSIENVRSAIDDWERGNRTNFPLQLNAEGVATCTLDDTHWLFGHVWATVVLDEAHRIRNATSQTFMACCALQSKHRIYSSGTPVHNKLDDLYNAFRFLRLPGLIGVREWERTPESARIKHLIDIAEKHVLWKKKDDIQGMTLAAKHVFHYKCSFESKEESAFYEYWNEYLGRLADEARKSKSEKTNSDDPTERDYGSSTHTHVFEAITKARQCCNAAGQVKFDPAEHPHAPKIDTNYQSWAFKNSTKMRALRFVTETHIPKNEKFVVFSNSVESLEIIRDVMQDMGIGVEWLTGSQTSLQRNVSIKRFKTESAIRCFCISIMAGGEGLNLEEASRVIIVDPLWDPQSMLQAMDRCHRVTSKKEVRVTIISIRGTIEDVMLGRGETKQRLSQEIYSAVSFEDMLRKSTRNGSGTGLTTTTTTRRRGGGGGIAFGNAMSLKDMLSLTRVLKTTRGYEFRESGADVVDEEQMYNHEQSIKSVILAQLEDSSSSNNNNSTSVEGVAAVGGSAVGGTASTNSDSNGIASASAATVASGGGGGNNGNGNSLLHASPVLLAKSECVTQHCSLWELQYGSNVKPSQIPLGPKVAIGSTAGLHSDWTCFIEYIGRVVRRLMYTQDITSAPTASSGVREDRIVSSYNNLREQKNKLRREQKEFVSSLGQLDDEIKSIQDSGVVLKSFCQTLVQLLTVPNTRATFSRPVLRADGSAPLLSELMLDAVTSTQGDLTRARTELMERQQQLTREASRVSTRANSDLKLSLLGVNQFVTGYLRGYNARVVVMRAKCDLSKREGISSNLNGTLVIASSRLERVYESELDLTMMIPFVYHTRDQPDCAPYIDRAGAGENSPSYAETIELAPNSHADIQETFDADDSDGVIDLEGDDQKRSVRYANLSALSYAKSSDLICNLIKRGCARAAQVVMMAYTWDPPSASPSKMSSPVAPQQIHVHRYAVYEGDQIVGVFVFHILHHWQSVPDSSSSSSNNSVLADLYVLGYESVCEATRPVLQKAFLSILNSCLNAELGTNPFNLPEQAEKRTAPHASDVKLPLKTFVAHALYPSTCASLIKPLLATMPQVERVSSVHKLTTYQQQHVQRLLLPGAVRALFGGLWKEKVLLKKL